VNVLIIADPHIPIPPIGYGGVERIVAALCQGLADRGHIVDLIAGPGSRRYGGALMIHRAPSKLKASRIYRKLVFQWLSWRASRKVDLVISHGRIDYLRTIAMGAKPLIQVFHNPTQQSEIDALLGMRKTGIRFIGVSRDQMSGMKPPELVDAIYNSVDLVRMVTQPIAESPPYLAFLGRLTANKGVHLAIQAAQIAGIKLVIAGNISDSEPGAREYFDTKVRPHLGPKIEYIGVVDDVAKVKLLGGASALLFPIQWKEPFGIVMAEALACGCPVIGWRNGSVSEVIQHGKTGFIVDSVDEMVAAIKAISSIDRASCRHDAETRFTQDSLVEGYLHSISKLIGK